ncbi:hypothetical protein U9M48_036047 [Paspalum notatum var. saurae]|uniref:Uncharacterized protein n=1 Tax=Paspalum notatum var. saurae TaxID=547442 RepID=A0AAQ3UDT8_PASNO
MYQQAADSASGQELPECHASGDPGALLLVGLLVASNCPSDCGWKAEDMLSLTHDKRNNSCQKPLVNMGSRSLTIEVGNPWERTMSAKKTWAMNVAVYGWPKAMKCANLENDRLAVHTGELFYKIHCYVTPN